MYKGIDHISLNVTDLKISKIFYGKLMEFLGFKKVGDTDGWSNGATALWINQTDSEYMKNSFHRRNLGISHLAFRAISREAVDHFHQEFLVKNNITALYDGPKEYSHYRDGYYAVYFEDPDRLKLETMYFPE